MKTIRSIAFVVMAGAAVAGCRLPWIGGSAPKGQVVATIDGQEITQLELQAELTGVNTPDPKARKAVEQRALQNIIVRRVMANAARADHLDKTSDFTIQRQRATDGLLAQMLQQKLAAAVPTPTDDEARRYVASHPEMFAQRKLFALDAIRMPPPSDAVMKGLQPLTTLDDVDAYLKTNHVEHTRGSLTLDALTANPKLIDAILKLPAGEVFIYPADGYLFASQVRDTQVSPIAPDVAAKYAAGQLKQQRTQEAAARQISALMSQAESKIQYNPAFKPAPPSKPAPGKSPSPAG